jgi:hypothetical protein
MIGGGDVSVRMVKLVQYVDYLGIISCSLGIVSEE